MRTLFLVLCFSLLCAGTSVAEEAAPRNHSLMTSESDVSVWAEPWILLSQGNPLWRNERLGNGTIGSQGCLFMNLVMILKELGFDQDPREFLTIFTKRGLIDQLGRMRLTLLPTVFPSLRIVDRQAASPQTDVTAIQSWLSERAFVLLKLGYRDSRGVLHQHWVRVARVEDNRLIVIDPNGGKIADLATLYGPNPVKEVLVLGKV
jgi:hypothetical protein